MRVSKKKSLSIIVPCYNEEKNVTLLYREFEESLKELNCPIEIIFIDDGSKDNTYEQLKRLSMKDEFSITIVHFSRNFGKEAAMYAGLEKSRGDYVVLIDADLQQDPKHIVEMYELLEKNEEYDAICCFQEKRIEGRAISYIKSKFYRFITSVSDVEFVDGASDFRMFRRYVVEAALSLTEKNRFSKGIFSWVGFKTCYIPYTPKSRIYGKSSFNFMKLFKYAFSGIISFSTVPLRIATYSGIFFAIMAFIYLCVVIIQKVFFTIDVPGYPTLIVTILLIGSLILFCLGIIGEYIARIYIETKKRPIYIEKEEIKSSNITRKK